MEINNLANMNPTTFPQLIRRLKFYALIAFILPFPIAYWTDSLRIDLFAIFYFPIAADKLEQTKRGNVAAWLFGITMAYFIATMWTLISLIWHMLGNDDRLYGSMSFYWSVLLCALYFLLAWYAFSLVTGLNKLLRSTRIEIDENNLRNQRKHSEQLADENATRPSLLRSVSDKE